MHQSVRDAFIPFTLPLEGRVRFMYLDIKSLVSTGIGNLLDADSAEHFGTNPVPLPDTFTLPWRDKNTGVPATRAEILAEWNTVKFSGTATATLAVKESITRLRIDDAAVDQLVMGKLASFETTLNARPPFADLQFWPADAQLGLFSMAWGLGPMFTFPKFQQAAAKGDFLTMAAECRMTEAGNPGVIPRNVRNGVLFTVADWNAAPPPGEFSTLIYEPGRSLAANMRGEGTFPFPIPLRREIGVQTALERLAGALSRPAYDPHGLDGVFGPGTIGALGAFQDDHGLPRTPGATRVADIGTGTVPAIEAELDDLGIGYWPGG
jgi:hypothetical protein